jgi:hypothetical protein
MCILFLLDYNTKTEVLILRTRLIHRNELNISFYLSHQSTWTVKQLSHCYYVINKNIYQLS